MKKPSEHFNVTILAVKGWNTRKEIVYAVRKTLKHKVNFRKKQKSTMHNELKGSSTKIDIKKYFYKKVNHVDFQLFSLTIKKIDIYQKLYPNIYPDKDRLYNWIAHLVLDKISFDNVSNGVLFILDKSKRRKEIEDFNRYFKRYIQTRVDPRVPIDIKHKDSTTDFCLSAADLFAWGIFKKYESKDKEWFECFKDKIVYEELFLT